MKIPFPLLPRALRWAGVVVVAAILFYGSLVTVPETVVDETQPGLVNIPLHMWRHVVAYFALAGSLAYATDHWEISRWKNALLVIGIAAMYGVAMEFGQSLVPHRTEFLVTDVIANAIGASCVVVWYVIRPYLDCKPVTAMFSEL